VKAVRQVGIGRAIRFLWTSGLLLLLRCAFLPPARTFCLRLFGATIGNGTIVNRCSFINADRGGFRALSIGRDCFIGDEVLFDLASPVTLEDQVTLAARVVLLTHMSVGYRDHPLQARFPARQAPVRICRGSFLGAGTIVLCGVTVGPAACVGAGSLVNRDVQADETVGGVPARPLGRQPQVSA
jgi:acetyltransferase-like isoleucine patch superfamily enzyme